MEVNDEFEIMDMEDDEFEFTLSEIMEMENLFKEMCDKFISQSFCQELATKFSHSVYRSEKFPVKWEQVRSWFRDKQSTLAVKATPSFSPDKTLASPRALPVKRRVSTISISEAAVELPNLMFEARSAKDYAWFDVAYFLNFRVLNSGELMVRVRFAGFDREEDEWVSADRAIRERSIPLVPTECDSVNVGDQVLCYRVNEYHALYVDAHVTGIEKRSHDESCCTCVFNVRYEYDNVEEKVGCNNLCRRPTQSSSKEIKASGFSILS
ncbi:protein SAWADEE HOMEODOMAIN HOMOLOG 1-like [Primulina eburnea]|uniref:protein SAWADEE HOMEODOMAIN HOMOLOG 1-like n=1 Tax=Primulina eburnea TaxID=1245227 RepID=UPI003C6C7CBF